MEFIESLPRSSSASRMARLTVTLISERSNWVSVSKPLANNLFDLNVLPVVLQVRTLDGAGFPSKKPHNMHYVAWTGGVLDGPATSPAGAGGSLGVPSALASALGLRAGAQVTAVPLLDVPPATVVEVEPVGESDWEVVEANAGFLEEQLLPQVGILSRGQLVTVWARGAAAVRLRVLATQPADLVRMVPGCEMHVAPKPRTLLPFGVPEDRRSRQPQVNVPGPTTRRSEPSPSAERAPAIVPLTGAVANWTGVGNHVNGGPGQQQQQQQQSYPLRRGPDRVPSFKWGPSAGSNTLANGNGLANGFGTARSLTPPYYTNAGGGGGPGPWSGVQMSPQPPTARDGAAAAAGGIGLQAPPAWASGLARQASGRYSSEQVSGPDVAAAAAAASALSNGESCRTNAAGLRSARPDGDAVPAGIAMATEGVTAAATATGSAAARGEHGDPCGASNLKAASSVQSLLTAGPAASNPAAAAAAAPLADAEAASAVRTAAPAAAPRSLIQPPPAAPPPSQQLPGPRSHPHHGGHQREMHPKHSGGCRPRYYWAAVPVPLRLRVLDLPAAKYMMPMPTSPPLPSSSSAAGTAAAPPPPPSVSTWLTLAVAVAPLTAAALAGGDGDAGDGGLVVRLHGRGTVRDLLGVLVPEPVCPPGHVMLAPPLQHVLCVLPHMYVTVTALPPAALTAAEATALPSLTLHPLPVPVLWRTAALAGGQTGAAPHASQAGGGAAAATAAVADGVLQNQAVLAVAAAAAAASTVSMPAAPPPALSHAVHQWLGVQLDGIRHAVHGCSSGGSIAGGGGGGGCSLASAAACVSRDDGDGPELLLPLASGSVVHFRLHVDCNAGSRSGARGSGSGGHSGNGGGGGDTGGDAALPDTGDYCMIVHAVRRTHTNAAATRQHTPPSSPVPVPPLLSERTIAALVAHSPTSPQVAASPSQSPALSSSSSTALATAQSANHVPNVSSLSTKLGQAIVLANVSYDSSRYAALLTQRPLPPPLKPQPATAALPAAEPSPQPATSGASTIAIFAESRGAAAADTSPAVASPAELPTTALPIVPAPVAVAPYSRSESCFGSKTCPAILDLDLEHISWLHDQLEQCLRRLLPQLDPWVGAAAARAGLPRCGGVLVTGPPGSGRSQLLAALGDICERHPAYQAHVLHVRCGQLAGGSHSSTSSALAALAAEALHCAPCLLLLDDLDGICPSAPEGSEYGMQHPDGAAASTRLADWLSALLDELAAATATEALEQQPAALAAVSLPPAVAVVASARDAAGLHAALRRVGRLDFEVRLPTPGSVGRASMLAAAARLRGLAVDPAQLAAVAGAAEGFEGVDLRLLLDRAVHVALRRKLTEPQATDPRVGPPALLLPPPPAAGGPAVPELSVTDGDLREALEGFIPAAFWGVQQASDAAGKADGWEDVGGLEGVVAALREALLLPVRYRDLVAAAPLRLRTGALLYGPPGCGKTHLVAAAVAAVSKIAPVRFLTVKGPELLNKYIGASEAAVRDLFSRAAAAAPAVLFFDEFDAIAPPRGHDSTGVTDRVVNQLLTELDGVEGLRGVVVLAATSRPDLIDAALLRPGRLDRLLFCGPPEGPGQRLQILRALSRRLNLRSDVDLGAVAEATEGMTGADLGAVLSEAQLHAINESVEAAAAGTGTGVAAGPQICMPHLRRALAAARPSLPAAEAARLAALYDRFRRDREAPGGRPMPVGGERGTRATLA